MKITQTKDIRAANRWEIMRQVLGNYPISRADMRPPHRLEQGHGFHHCQGVD